MQVRLEVARNKANVKRVVLRNDVIIGRSPDCNLRIASNEVSRQHCKITLTDRGVLVRDLNSSNGTFVDGRQIEPETDVAVAPGAKLSIGGIEFVVRYELPEGVPSVGPASTVDLPPEQAADVLSPAALDDEPVGAPAAGEPESTVGDTDDTVRVEPEPARSSGDNPSEDNPFAFLDPGEAPSEPAPPFDITEGPAQEAPAGGDDAGEEPADAPEAEPAESPAKRRSLFGLFGRKKKGEPQAAEEANVAPPAAPPTDDEETIVAAEGPDEPEPETAPHFAEVSEEDAAGFLTADEESPSSEDGDEDLGDFLKKLG